MVARFLCAFLQKISGQRSASWDLPGLRLYLCSLGFGVCFGLFLSFTFWYISRINLFVYWVSVDLYGSYECILIDC